MLNIEGLDEDDVEVKRKPTKLRIKEEKALAAQRKLEEAKYNLRKEKLDYELKYEASCHDTVKAIYDKLGYELKWPLIQANSRHQRGAFELLVELSDRRIRLLEDAIRGRELRSSLVKAMHIEVINRLLKKHETNINTLTADFLKSKDKMMANRREFLQTALLKGKQLRDEIRLASYASDKGEVIQQLIQKHEIDLANYNEMCSKRFDEFYRDYEKRILDKWTEYKNIYENYKKESEELRRLIYIANDRDTKENDEIVKLKRMRMKFEAQFEASKNIVSPGMVRDLNDIEKKVEDLDTSLKDLQKIQKRCSQKDQESLDHLNRVSDIVLKNLRNVKKLAEKVVRLRRSCRSLETNGELVKAGDLCADDPGAGVFPSAEVLEVQTARVLAQNAFMKEKIHHLKREETSLKLRLRGVISQLGELADRAHLAGKLYHLDLQEV